MTAARDPRWIILTEEGNYSIIGRYREPHADSLRNAEASLRQLQTAGWLAIMGDSMHSKNFPEFVQVKELGNPKTTFEDAVERLRATSNRK